MEIFTSSKCLHCRDLRKTERKSPIYSWNGELVSPNDSINDRIKSRSPYHITNLTSNHKPEKKVINDHKENHEEGQLLILNMLKRKPKK